MQHPPLKAHFSEYLLEAGCDEAGRGCLAGPVFAAAVILPGNFFNDDLTDSKVLSKSKRDALRPIIEQQALSWAVARIDPETIDQINILNASIRAMHLAVGMLKLTPQMLLIDGNRFTPVNNIPHTCIIRGDSQYFSIAAASVLAKTYRDAYMLRLHEEYPYYHWDQNKGYPSRAHRTAILQFGPSPHHRKSFRLTAQYRLPI